MTFKEKVLEVVKKITEGKTLSYKQVAELSGSPKAFRAVGNILKKNYNPEIPCQRVIKSDGSLRNYNKGKKIKKEMLVKEKFLVDTKKFDD